MATNKSRNVGSRVVVLIRASLRVGGSGSQSRSAGDRFDKPKRCWEYQSPNRHRAGFGAPAAPVVPSSCGSARENRHGGGVLIGIGQGRGVPAPALGGGKDLGAAGTPWVIGGAPPTNHRHDKRVACPVQIADSRHT